MITALFIVGHLCMAAGLIGVLINRSGGWKW